jgi:serine/threonine-protein kinase CHEK1
VRIARDKQSSLIYAVKVIDKENMLNGHDPKTPKGKQILKQLDREYMTHKECADHRNVIAIYFAMDSPIWRWIAMELAEGGDLFDKIGLFLLSRS